MPPSEDISMQLLTTHIAVYETAEFTAAASRLHVAQSTVSKRIALLERRIGARLFVRRTSDDAVATRAGRDLYDSAVRIVRLWSDTRFRMQRRRQGVTSFCLLMSHTASTTLLPRVITAIQDLLDTMDFTVHTMNSDAIVSAIERKQAQLGIIEKPVGTDAVSLRMLGEDHLVLAGRDAGDRTLWLVREPGSGVRYYTDLYQRTIATSRPATVELDSNDKICALLAHGIGRSIVSRDIVPPGVPVRSLPNAFTRHFYAVTAQTGLDPDQRGLCDAIIEAVAPSTL